MTTFCRREVFEDEATGRRVTLLIPMADEFLEDRSRQARFVAELQCQPPGTNVVIQQRVELKAETLADAFAELPAAEVEAVRLVQEQINAAQRRVVAAKEVPIVANGKLRMSE